MKLLPRSLVVGAFSALNPGPEGLVSVEKLNRVWAELAPLYNYRQLQLAPDASGAQFVGATTEDGITIQPPLIQVRRPISMTADIAADEAQSILRVIQRHLGVSQFFNLGIKHVFHADPGDNDGRGFVLHKVLRKDDAELADLAGSGTLWAGVKYIVASEFSSFTLVIEPLLADPRYLFLDLDAQFPGPANVDTVKDRAKEAQQYLAGAVTEYLDRAATGA
jgi:hypothetical protein